MRSRFYPFFMLFLGALGLSLPLAAKEVKFETPVKPFKKQFAGTSVQKVEIRDNTIVVPFITWAGDGPMIIANGGKDPNAGSFFHKNYGFKVQMVNGDNFLDQIRNYLSGKSPFLRGTLGMINLSSEAIGSTEETKPLVFLKYSWSAGADGLAVRSHVTSPKDLKGRTIILQQYSPHYEFLEQILADAGLTHNDVNLKFVEQIIEPQKETPHFVDPANAFRFDPTADAVFCIAPDTGTLTSQGTVGTGAEGSVKGAKLLVTSKTASRVIADVLAVRRDFAKENPKIVAGLLAGFLKGVEQLQTAQTQANNGQGAEYDRLCSLVNKVLLEDENPMAVKGMLQDLVLSDFSENSNFFNKSQNPVGFAELNRKHQTYLKRNGYLTAGEVLQCLPLSADDLKGHLGDTSVKKQAAAFHSEKETRKILTEMEKKSTSGVLFEYTFYFKPNEVDFQSADYEEVFKRINELGQTYGGAVINIIGHGDPSLINKMVGEGKPQPQIQNMYAASKRMTYRRAMGVKKALLQYAEGKDLMIDDSQLIPTGKGIEEPLHADPRNEEEWKKNMRVEVEIINIEAEAKSFPGGK